MHVQYLSHMFCFERCAQGRLPPAGLWVYSSLHASDHFLGNHLGTQGPFARMSAFVCCRTLVLCAGDLTIRRVWAWLAVMSLLPVVSM